MHNANKLRYKTLVTVSITLMKEQETVSVFACYFSLQTGQPLSK